MDSTDQNRPNENVNKSQRLSFSLAIPSPIGKRKSFSRPRTPPPTCEERVHYPIFNPRNPRHNPPLTPSSWHGSGYYIPQAEAPSSRNSVRWMQTLPGRSLRKARSGFLALRSGMRNQRSQNSHGLNHNEAIPNIWSSSDSAEGSFEQQGEYFPSTISEASTEEDYDFGIGLYRTRCNCSSALFGELDKYTFKGPPITLSGPGPMPEMHLGSCSFADLSSVERPLNSLCQENIQALTAKKSPNKQKSRGHGGGVRRVSFQADASESVDKSSSSSSDNADIPQLGISLSMEPLQLFNKSQSVASSHSNVKAPQESPAESTGSVVSSHSKEDSQVSHSRESCNNDGETIEQRSDETDAQTEEGAEMDVLSRLSYRPDLLEAWVADFCNSQQDGDLSVGPSMHSNTHSEGFTSTVPTSVSNNNRSSIEEDILSLTSLSMKDEYFLVDGKTSDMHPGGGDDAIKAEESLASDASIHHVDRSPSIRSQQVCEIVGPGGPPQMPVGNRRENSDSSNEEYLVTYSMWQRHYLS